MSGAAAEIARQVRDARADGGGLRIVGAGTWLDAGAPCTATGRVDLSGLAGIVDYEPGDLTLTARAGTPLADIERATAEHGQWLPLEPFGAGGTIGATVATGSYGPLAAAYGTPRDQVLGCEVVTGAGDVIRTGGKVVKNVAGFDVTRLMIGAWGTLGVLTEVTLRLRARPEAESTVAVSLGGHGAVEHAIRWLGTAEIAPLAAELLSPELAGRLGIATANAPVLLMRLGGNAAYLQAALDRATALGDVAPLDGAIWRSFAVAELGTTTVRVSCAPAEVARLWQAASVAMQESEGFAHANLKRGVVRLVLPADPQLGPVGRLAGVLRRIPSATGILERAPAEAWTPIVGEPAKERLARGVRHAFDPDLVLNPGILGTLSTALA